MEFPLLVAVIVALIGWMGAPLTPRTDVHDLSMLSCMRTSFYASHSGTLTTITCTGSSCKIPFHKPARGLLRHAEV